MASGAEHIAIATTSAALAPQTKTRASALGALGSFFSHLTGQPKIETAAPAHKPASLVTQANAVQENAATSVAGVAARVERAKSFDPHTRVAEALARASQGVTEAAADSQASDDDVETAPAQGSGPRHRVAKDETPTDTAPRRVERAVDTERLEAILARIEAPAQTVTAVRELIADWRQLHDGGEPEGLRELVAEIRSLLREARADNAPVLADLERTLAPREDGPRFMTPTLDVMPDMGQIDVPPLVRADEQKLAALAADAKPPHQPTIMDQPPAQAETAPRPPVAPPPQQAANTATQAIQAATTQTAAPTPTQTVTAPQPIAMIVDAPAPDTQTLPQIPAVATTARAFAPNTIVDIAARIATKFGNGVRSFDIRLDPPELGRVDVRMEIATDGRVRAVLSAERTEAVEMLRRDGHALERALRDSGLDLKDGGLTFTLKDGGGSGERFADGAWRYEAMAARRETDADAALLAPIEPAAARIRVGGLDIVI